MLKVALLHHRQVSLWGRLWSYGKYFLAPAVYLQNAQEFCSFGMLSKCIPTCHYKWLLHKPNTSLPCVTPLSCHYASMKVPKKESKGKKGAKPKIILTNEEMQQVINVEALTEQLNKVIENLKADYVKHINIRTAPGSLDTLPVKFDGQVYPLNELAQVTRKNPQLIVINLSSLPTAVQDVKLAILESGMNLNPQQEGNTLYVAIPKVTKEHREHLAKNAKSIFMKCKDHIRDVQNRFVKQAKEQKETLSEDLVFNTQQQIIAMGDLHVAEAEKLMVAKQNELLGTK